MVAIVEKPQGYYSKYVRLEDVDGIGTLLPGSNPVYTNLYIAMFGGADYWGNLVTNSDSISARTQALLSKGLPITERTIQDIIEAIRIDLSSIGYSGNIEVSVESAKRLKITIDVHEFEVEI